jgi:hypothetical protein
MFLIRWIDQDDAAIYEEVHSVLRRNDVDESIFYVLFFKYPNMALAKRLLQYRTDL